jgi:predicted DNA-binding protein (MmcQ/YjbR family)
MDDGGEGPLERLRALCALLPETAEIDGFGDPTFRVGTKTFALFETVATHPTVCVKVAPADQAALVAREGFVAEPHTGHHGWTQIRADGPAEWDEIDRLVVASYRLVAPPECVGDLDARLGT